MFGAWRVGFVVRGFGLGLWGFRGYCRRASESATPPNCLPCRNKPAVGVWGLEVGFGAWEFGALGLGFGIRGSGWSVGSQELLLETVASP